MQLPARQSTPSPEEPHPCPLLQSDAVAPDLMPQRGTLSVGPRPERPSLYKDPGIG